MLPNRLIFLSSLMGSPSLLKWLYLQPPKAAVCPSLTQVGINGAVRTFKQSDAADMEARKVRYFKTVDAPEVEIQVVLETSDSPQKSIIGRVKAWDAGVPLMCAYNRVEVAGDCDL